eukprot:TRINITY_DN8155_c3_g1_i1.p1 TRINITY_DN8155_c3_g1~~TRINITY_DN8155_c3_g1_i1.p1  ORF type:complete len:475 (+),score=180.21 TRINITY_DN8155_c3_g1_i1:229-1653(+)
MSYEDGLVSNYEEIWTISFDDLDLGRVIGKGAFGVVYHANYFGTEVAVKKLEANDEEDELYLQREVGVLKSIRHPNVVTFMGVCRKPTELNSIYIVTEFVSKGSLRQNLKASTLELTWGARGRMALDIACALAYLHSRSIIFRDLKSKNILIDDNNRAKICDFGFARLSQGRGARALTLCGTDDWMAPEVILGMEYDGQCDVFSYGIVLLELITRRKVSEALQRSPMEAFDLDEKKTRALLPRDCPAEFAELAFQCCRYEPNDRPVFRDIVRSLSEMIKKGIFQDQDAQSSSSSSPSSTPEISRSLAPPAASPVIASHTPSAVPPVAAWGADPFAPAASALPPPTRGGPALRRAAGPGGPRGGPGGPPRGGPPRGGPPRGGAGGPPRGGPPRGGPGGPGGAPRGGAPRGGAPRGGYAPGPGAKGPGSPGPVRATSPSPSGSNGANGANANNGAIRFVSRSGPTSESISYSDSSE